MKKKLNGWQRLWILIISLYLTFVLYFASISFPNKSDLYREWAYSILDLEKKHDKSINSLSNWEIREAYTKKGITDEKFIERLKEKSIEKPPDYQSEFAEIEKKHSAKIIKLKGKQIRYTVNALLIWFLPSSLIYILGISIAWVYKGFKK